MHSTSLFDKLKQGFISFNFQTRYRWTYRPMTISKLFHWHWAVVEFCLDGGRGGPYRPSNELKPIPDPKPIVPNYTQKTASLPIYITTQSTTTTTQSTTTTDLPTPAPYTGPYPPNVESNKNFMRQTKPEFATTESAKYGNCLITSLFLNTKLFRQNQPLSQRTCTCKRIR